MRPVVKSLPGRAGHRNCRRREGQEGRKLEPHLVEQAIGRVLQSIEILEESEAGEVINRGRQEDFINFLSFNIEGATALCSGGLQLTWIFFRPACSSQQHDDHGVVYWDSAQFRGE